MTFEIWNTWYGPETDPSDWMPGACPPRMADPTERKTLGLHGTRPSLRDPAPYKVQQTLPMNSDDYNDGGKHSGSSLPSAGRCADCSRPSAFLRGRDKDCPYSRVHRGERGGPQRLQAVLKITPASNLRRSQYSSPGCLNGCGLHSCSTRHYQSNSQMHRKYFYLSTTYFGADH